MEKKIQNNSPVKSFMYVAFALSAFYAGYFFNTHEIRAAENKISVSKEIEPTGVRIASNKPHISAAQDFSPVDLYSSVLNLVQDEYVDKITQSDVTKLSYGTIRGLLARLDDPSSVFLEPEEAKAFTLKEEGTASGAGIVVRTVKKIENGLPKFVLEAVSILPGSPAEKAGVRAGDIIDSINSQWILSYSLSADLEPLRKAVRNKKATQADLIKAVREANAKQENAITESEAIKLLSNPSKDALRLGIIRTGVKNPFELKVTPASSFSFEPVVYHLLQNQWGYIQLRTLGDKAVKEFSEDLKTLSSSKGLILDLRDNSGDNEKNAIIVLSQLLPSSTVVAEKQTKASDKIKKPIKITNGHKVTLPIVVIVNRGTYNLPEMIALALHDSSNAKIVGSSTHGDSFTHKHITLADGSLVILTTGRYFTDKGLSFQNTGVTPDIAAASTGNYGDPVADLPLAKAVASLKGGGTK